jgi:hypothetical protein
LQNRLELWGPPLWPPAGRDKPGPYNYPIPPQL